MRIAVFAAAVILLSLASAQEPPKGKVTKYTWSSSKIFPGTVRDYWIYVPAQYRPDKPACVMVFQDGAGYQSEQGAWRVPAAFDSLIAQGGMPPTIGIFIDPGVLPGPAGSPIRYNRSYEYDDLSDRYARFLLDEILPEVAKQYSLSKDPNDRAISGLSSGAIAAFTVAWLHPESFRRVLSFIGSYADLRGGEIYPALVRKTEAKPLRVFLQDGTADLNIFAGNWYLSNQALYSALEYAGYDAKFVVGSEGHNAKHGAVILADALRWLWRDYPKPIETPKTPAASERRIVSEIVDGDWEIVSQGHGFTEGPAVDREGNVYFSDFRNNRIYKAAVDGKVTLFREDAGGTNGLMFGPDGRLYAAQNGRKRIVAYSTDGTETVLAEDVPSNDIAVSASGNVYFTDPPGKRVWLIDAKGNKRVVNEGMTFPNGVRLSPDQSMLAVADMQSRTVWTFQIQPDGSLANGEPFYRLDMPDDSAFSNADGMTYDSDGYLYVATKAGLQICDPPGRVVAILGKPQDAWLSNAVFGGPNLDYLYVTIGDKIYRRHTHRKGIYPWQPVRLPVPRL